MAEIAGFRGLMYDASRVEMSKVLAPPYDVIDGPGREHLAAMHPKNCIRIILPEATEDGDAKYHNARDTISAWTDEGTLVRDDKPALYRYHQIFRSPELGSSPVTRRGFIAAVRLHDFDERVILRHERTLKGPKVDRLKLWETTQCHLSQIFTLYSDPASAVDAVFAETETRDPTLDGTTEDGTRHLLWRVSDPDLVAPIQGLMADKKLYIADGHHRYETMLAFRDQLLAQDPDVSAQSSARFGMMFLANLDDPGLVVLPTHRMVHSVSNFDMTKLRAALQQYFDIRELPAAAGDADLLRRELAKASEQGTSFVVMVPGTSGATVLTLKSGVDLEAAGVTGSKETRSLDVTLLHTLVLEGMLGIDKAALEAQSNIQYVKDTQVALDLCAAGKGQVCFLMNATPVSDVVAVSDADEIMPQKSTFFYPKIASGMVFNPVALAEEL